MRARALLIALAGLLAMLQVASARAADPIFTATLVTPNFVVHYTTAAGSPDAISPAVAQLVGDNAEKSLAAEEAAFGFDPPLAGPDGHIDIYVYEFRAASSYGIVAPRVPDADQSESYMLLRTSTATTLAVIAHEMFHVLQDSVWVPGGTFLDEATAEWAQSRAFPKEGLADDFDPSLSLDCGDPAVCQNAGYQSWSFFEFLSERYGPRIVREIFGQAKALRVSRGAAPMAAVSAVVAARGATLGPVFRDFAFANVNGDYSLDELNGAGLAGLTDTAPLRTGAATRKLPRRAFKIDHLATNYVPVEAGGAKKGKCRKASLRLDVTGPKGDAFAGYARGEGKPKPIAMANGRGRLSLRSWSTCAGPELTLALVNAGAAGDNRTFAVTAQLTVR